MGHSLMRLPHFVHVTMCPHSRSTQSIGESMQILHMFSSIVAAAEESVCKIRDNEKQFLAGTGIFIYSFYIFIIFKIREIFLKIKCLCYYVFYTTLAMLY